MPLGALLGALKVTAEQIAELWPEAPALTEWLGQVQSKYSGGNQFLQFAKIARLGDPTLSLKDISPIYQAAKFFTDQLKYLGATPVNMPIDRRLATPIETPTGLSPAGTTMRYKVDLIVTNMPDGKPMVHSHWIGTNYERSRAELLDMARRAEQRRWKDDYEWVDEEGETQEPQFEIEITRFERFYS